MQLPLFENGSPKKSRKSTGKMAVHYASTGNQWQTPQHILERAIDVLGAIDLDPIGYTAFSGANGAMPGWLGGSGIGEHSRVV